MKRGLIRREFFEVKNILGFADGKNIKPNNMQNHFRSPNCGQGCGEARSC